MIVIRKVTNADTGSYSCVYSEQKVEPGMRIKTRDNDSVTLRLTVLAIGDVMYVCKGLFHPASITLMQETVNTGDTVTFYCKMAPDIEVHRTWNFYLCKNGESIMLQKWSRAESGVTFVIRKVTNADTGSYSCVYSEQKVEPGMRIKTRDNDSVTLRLTGLFHPASITLMQETVNTGDTVTFYCKMPPDIEVHRTWNLYLCKNGESIMLQKWSRAESGVTFVIRKVTNADTGSYSCVYSEQKVEPGMRIKTRDNDSVTLRLTASLFVEYAVRHFLSAVITLLILGLLFKVYRARMHEPEYATMPTLSAKTQWNSSTGK
ncbi:UNVERIFIED_CONTAM: hypothetical protein FKN15_005708 [Acipenser sinensis]